MRTVQDAQPNAGQNATSEVIGTWGQILTALQGRKTYATLIVTAVLLLGQYLHWWTLPDEVFKGLQLMALAFIKAGVARSLKGKTNETLIQTGAPTTGAPISQTPQ